MRLPTYILLLCLLTGCSPNDQDLQRKHIKTPPEKKEALPDKRIEVFLDEQWLECWEESRLIFSFPCSTGTEDAPTPTGLFTALDKTGGGQYHVGIKPFIDFKWQIVFEEKSRAAIHGWPWNMLDNSWCEDPRLVGHKPLSGGCVMLLWEDMERVFDWASVGTPIRVFDYREKSH